MKATYAAQTAARNSNVARLITNDTPVVRAVDLFTEPQIHHMHMSAGNTRTARTILSELKKKEHAGFRLCNVFRDVKRTCERTLGLAV